MQKAKFELDTVQTLSQSSDYNSCVWQQHFEWLTLNCRPSVGTLHSSRADGAHRDRWCLRGPRYRADASNRATFWASPQTLKQPQIWVSQSVSFSKVATGYTLTSIESVVVIDIVGVGTFVVGLEGRVQVGVPSVIYHIEAVVVFKLCRNQIIFCDYSQRDI